MKVNKNRSLFIDIIIIVFVFSMEIPGQNQYYKLTTERTLKFPTVHFLQQELKQMTLSEKEDPLVEKLLNAVNEEVSFCRRTKIYLEFLGKFCQVHETFSI